ncbi:MAG TPA: sigma-70 family RNA polymerase sigma factor, partial [Nannocystaceae bacterium]|nr:sigma-70 family RNA polymerase sigma factor [Nannocystaceae bacterium]
MQPEPALDLAILYRRERAFVRSVLVSLGVAAAALDDAIQDVFVVVFRRLHDYDHRRGTMRAWLLGIAMRVAATQRRRARPSKALVGVHSDDAALGDPERYVAKLGAAALADRLISAVPADQWVPFVMAEVEGMTAPEIADALGVRVATVYTRIHRARQRLERERARMLGDRPSSWWAVVMVRVDAWTQPRPLAMAAFVSLRMTIALAITAIVLAVLAVLVTRTSASPDPAPPEAATAGATSSNGGGSSRTRDADDADDLAAKGPATIAGRVTTPSGPLAGVRVCAWPEHNQLEARFTTPMACTSSDARGRYELARMRSGRWVVTASATGWAAASHRPPPPATALVLRGGERRDGIDIALGERGTTLRVMVRDLTGGPIEGATVFAGSDRPDISTVSWLARPPSVGESNADGLVEMSVRPGGVEVRARADGYAEGSRNGTA